MIQESVQNIKTPWELVVAIICFLAICLVYIEKKRDKERNEESKYHRDRAEKLDEGAKKDREKFYEMAEGFKEVAGKMVDKIDNKIDKIDNKIDEVLREVRK